MIESALDAYDYVGGWDLEGGDGGWRTDATACHASKWSNPILSFCRVRFALASRSTLKSAIKAMVSLRLLCHMACEAFEMHWSC